MNRIICAADNDPEVFKFLKSRRECKRAGAMCRFFLPLFASAAVEFDGLVASLSRVIVGSATSVESIYRSIANNILRQAVPGKLDHQS
jgi:hypothetical protein